MAKKKMTAEQVRLLFEVESLLTTYRQSSDPGAREMAVFLERQRDDIINEVLGEEVARP